MNKTTIKLDNISEENGLIKATAKLVFSNNNIQYLSGAFQIHSRDFNKLKEMAVVRFKEYLNSAIEEIDKETQKIPVLTSNENTVE